MRKYCSWPMLLITWKNLSQQCIGGHIRAKYSKRIAKPHWQKISELLPELDAQSAAILALLPQALEQVWPLTKAHKRQLPHAVRDLSAALTCQRSELRSNYWNKPAFVSAYLYYFLPWNLVRLCRLLPGIGLPEPQEKTNKLPLLLDAGSGPLTLPLALWICKPEWRAMPLSVFALDSSRQPIEIGKNLLAALAKICNQPTWPVRTKSGPIEALAKLAPESSKTGRELYPWLISAANVLNELKDKGQIDTEEDGSASRLGKLLIAWQPLWQQGAPLLFIEPGTRLGGTTIMRLRKAGLELGLLPISPCTHDRPCPLLRPERPEQSKTWCHFIFSAQAAPEWLKELSRKAGLFKTSLTLSPLLLVKEPSQKKELTEGMPCRIISQAFPVAIGMARYGCCKAGLGLLPDSRLLESGACCLAKVAKDAVKDKKSGAVILEAVSDHNSRMPESPKKL